MNIELTEKEFRRLLDMVYVGNWILNSTREDKRIKAYDELESKIFSYCIKAGMYSLFEVVDNEVLPSMEFADGGIHEAIMSNCLKDNTTPSFSICFRTHVIAVSNWRR